VKQPQPLEQRRLRVRIHPWALDAPPLDHAAQRLNLRCARGHGSTGSLQLFRAFHELVEQLIERLLSRRHQLRTQDSHLQPLTKLRHCAKRKPAEAQDDTEREQTCSCLNSRPQDGSGDSEQRDYAARARDAYPTNARAWRARRPAWDDFGWHADVHVRSRSDVTGLDMAYCNAQGFVTAGHKTTRCRRYPRHGRHKTS
jgi:hypothetical protein